MLRVAAILSFLFYPCISVAQQFLNTRYYRSEGLDFEKVISIQRDKSGILWLGCEGGISSYDGVSFQNLTVSHDSVSLLGSNYFFFFKNRLLLLSTPRNLEAKSTIFQIVDGRVIVYERLQMRLYFNSVLFTPPVQLANGGWLYPDFDNGISTTGSFIPSFLKRSFSTSNISFRSNSDGHFFILEPHKVLIVAEERLGNLNFDGDFLAFLDESNRTANDEGVKLLKKTGIYKVEAKGEIKSEMEFASPFPGKMNRYRCKRGVNIICIYNSEELWVYSHSHGKWLDVKLSLSKPSSGIHTAEVDFEDNLWVGTSFGVQKLNRFFFSNHSNIIPDNADEVSAICLTSQGMLIGGRNWVVFFKEGRRVFYRKFNQEEKKINRLLFSHSDSLGNIWFVMSSSGLFRLNKDMVLTGYPQLGNRVTSVYPTEKGSVWISDETSIYEFEPHRGVVFQWTNSDIRYIRKVIKLGYDSIGVVTPNFFYLISPSKNKIIARLPGSNLYNASLVHGKIYVYGTNLYSLFNGKLTEIHLESEIGNGDIYAISEGPKQTVYLGCSQGVYQVDGNFKVKEKFTMTTGYSIVDINRGAFAYNNGELWVGTAQGLFRFFNDYDIKNKPISPFLVSRFNKYNLNNSGDTAITLKLPYYERNQPLIIKWPLLEQEKSNYISFKIDNRDWDTTNLVSNLYLPILGISGKHSIQYYAFNSTNNARTDIKHLWIQISTPWYRKTWATIVFVCFTLFFFYMILRWRLKVAQNILKKQKLILENDLRGIKTQLSPHFLHNAFSILLLNMEDNGNGVKNREYLQQLSLYFRKVLAASEKAIHTLEEELEFTEEYLKLQQQIFDPVFEYEIIIPQDFDTYTLEVPTMLLQPFIENSLKHGFGGITYKGQIVVKLVLEEGYPVIIISDNGKGLSGKFEELKEGVGMRSSRMRLGILAAKQKIGKTLITISDLPLGKGTETKIIIPNNYE